MRSSILFILVLATIAFVKSIPTTNDEDQQQQLNSYNGNLEPDMEVREARIKTAAFCSGTKCYQTCLKEMSEPFYSWCEGFFCYCKKCTINC